MFDNLSERLQEIIHKTSSNSTLTEENMSDALREIRRALIASDVSLNVVKSFISNIKEKAQGADVLRSVKPSEMLIKIVSDELTDLLGKEKSPLKLDSNPSIIMMLGLQGSGKTTASAKLALRLKSEGKKPLLVAMDIYRPAAIQQLKTLADSNQVDFFSLDNSKDVTEIAKKALEYAKNNNNTVLIFDTAGRLQIDTDMMAELLIIDKLYPLNEKLLVVDSMTGQEAIDIAKNFDEQLNITGVILTKLDGDTRGGCALSIVYSTGKPIKFTGTGEKIAPLDEFYPDRMASRILGMGSVEVEKYMCIERFSHVMHIGSTVTGKILDEKDALDAVDAVLPAGTLSGAPKLRACEIIHELERTKRGIYGGAIGYIDFTGNLDTCIAIRIAYAKHGKVFVRSGAGIVADSVPEMEFAECENKAKAVMQALQEAEGGIDL